MLNEEIIDMSVFKVPTKDEVSPDNQEIFDQLNSKLGTVPNLFATMALSDNALGAYLGLSEAQGRGSLSAKEREVVSLAVSQANSCRYCQSAHTAIAKMNGFSDEEALGFRKGTSDDPKLAALAALAREVTVTRGNPSQQTLQAFLDAGYEKGGLIDVVLVVADTTFTNYVNNITQIPIDFPVVPDLSEEVAA